MREPKAAKSFRAAGDRIVRQESAMPSVVTRLLAPPSFVRRKRTSDGDGWPIRLAALATLGQYDGLVVMADESVGARFTYNVAGDPLDDASLRSAIEETERSGSTVQTRATVRLADDRLAGSAMVAPLVATDAVHGVLVALRVGRSFAAADALTASGVSELLALEIARETAIRRDETHRRQAFALYELARLALFGESLTETLAGVTALVVRALDHDLAQIWLFEPDGGLRLVAAEPGDGLRFERIQSADHDALAQALHQGHLVRVGHGALRPWVPAETRELMVAPLGDRARMVGVLVLGRLRERYSEADEELADLVSRFVGRLVDRVSTRDRDGDERRNQTEPESDRDWVGEPELSRS